jgi:hypothetical protein
MIGVFNRSNDSIIFPIEAGRIAAVGSLPGDHVREIGN